MPTSTWSKSDYKFFAEVLHNTPMSLNERGHFSSLFNGVFAEDNPNFDWRRWRAAVFEGKTVRTSSPLRYGGWTAKTYRMTADVLNDARSYPSVISEDTFIALISAFGAAFERDNPKFDWGKFRIAAGSPYAYDPEHGDYLTSGDDPDMPGGGPPVYHGPEERYGGRRVRVHQHFRSKPGGPKRLKYVSVRAHNREV